jgi:hypothetical protein
MVTQQRASREGKSRVCFVVVSGMVVLHVPVARRDACSFLVLGRVLCMHEN